MTLGNISPDQKPTGSPFGTATTATEVIHNIDLMDKLAIVTGGYSGIGLEIKRALSGAGATVIVPARDAVKAAAALHGIKRVEPQTLDLTNTASIASFARRVVSLSAPSPMVWFSRPGYKIHPTCCFAANT